MATAKMNKLKAMLAELPSGEIHIDKIRPYIREYIGMDERTVNNTLRQMAELGLIKEVKPFVFVVNGEKKTS